ncbi:MAG: SwmB domain-containing protein [Nitrospinae bacterium]|nr:SwmB domain-containing protein [Nitrospinota bacterium]
MANDTPAPMFSGASVNGTTLEVTFDLALDAVSAPAGSAFTVSTTRPGGSKRTITGTGAASVSGMTATVTLAEAVTHGEAVTVSYKAPDADPLQDAAGNEAQGFTDRPAANLTPDTAPPAFTDATVYENTLTVTFDEALDAGSAPAGSAFRVTATPPDGTARTIAGTGAASVSGMTATVTLAGAVAHGETVTVSYTKPGTNPLRDTAGNEAENFPEQAAVNNTPAEPDTTPPALWSATVQGSVLVLTYSETLDPGHTPGPGRFAVTVAGAARAVTDVEIRGGSVVLTLESAVTKGQNVRLTYEVPAIPGPGNVGIQDYAGNLAGRIGNRRLAGDTRAPRLVAATVEGAVLTLTYDEELDPSVAPPTGSFFVERNFIVKERDPNNRLIRPGDLDREYIGVTGVRIRDRAVILTLAKAVLGDDKVIVNYILKSDDYRIQDYAGNLAGLIPYMTVTHGPPPTTRTPPPGGGSVAAPGFGVATVDALTLTAGEAMTPVVLPAATGGDGELTYDLTSEPAGLAGLSFDPATRRLSGTPAAGRYQFTYTAHDADANRSSSDAAALTFAVTVGAAPDRAAREAVRQILRQTLAAVGTRTLAGVLGNVNARFADAVPGTGVRLAGREVLLGGGLLAVLERACPAERYVRPLHERAAPGGCGAAGITRDELMRASAFTWTPASADGGGDAPAPLWAVWGRGDFGSFEGRPEAGARYEGETRTGWLGFDMRRGPWVAGLALAHGTSEADYGVDLGAGDAGRGRLETTLTAVYPYGRWRFANGLELRLVLGAGEGEARHRPEDEERETGDLDMRMASVGLRRELAPVGGFDLAVRADASFVRMEVEAGPETISGVSADTRRLRLGLEASRRIELGGGAALTPFLEAAARRDGGDGLTGSGVEIAGGARYTAARFQIEARGRWLAAHSEDAAREQGVSVTVRMGPGAEGRGLSFALTPRWGAPAGGAEALWRDEMPRLAVAREAAVDARVGYGFAWAGRGLVTPFAETSAGGAGSRLRLGTRFEASRADLDVEFAGERTERETADPSHGLRLDVRYRF